MSRIFSARTILARVLGRLALLRTAQGKHRDGILFRARDSLKHVEALEGYCHGHIPLQSEYVFAQYFRLNLVGTAENGVCAVIQIAWCEAE